METPVPESPAAATTPRVAAIVLARRAGALDAVLSSIEAQVYEPSHVFVVSETPVPETQRTMPFTSLATMAEVLQTLGPAVDYVWVVDDGTLPRPDALNALVETAARIDASVVGSKLLNAERSEELVSVGGSTDVFGFPYTGIEQGEVDQEQYDVIRDVAYVEPASMLVRRDLAVGLGGLDAKLPYLTSGLDFCQRARLAGGRVVVAPTAEVLRRNVDADRALTWREQAGRMRSMLKTYSALTLLWSVPAFLVIGLALSLYRTFNGSPLALVDWVRALVWNIAHLPSTVAARSRARRSRLAGDEELFRYQVRGSVEMRAVAAQVGALLQDEDQDEADDIADLLDQSPGFWQQPAFLAAVFGAAFVLAFTRELWTEGMPVVGFSLPLADSAWDTLRAYAGGWHMGGLGSPEPMHPAVGATAVAQLIVGGRGPLAAAALSVGSVAAGMAGTTRLVRRLGLGHTARYLAGVVYVAGAPMLAIAGEGYWPAMLGIGGLPWVLAGVVHDWPRARRPRIGRLARLSLAMMWSVVFVPLLVAVPLAFAVLWGIATRRIEPIGRAAVVTALSLPALLPWLVAQTPGTLLGDGPAFHFNPSWWAVTPILVAAVLVILVGQGAPARIGILGALLGGVGFVAARSSDLGGGRELTVAGVVLVALGLALVVAGALDILSELETTGPLRRSLARLGIAGALATVALVAVAVPPGRAGLPADDFSSLAFADSRAGRHGTDRLLLIGPGEQLPGDFRRLEDGTAYRLVGGMPTFDQAWLPAMRGGDDALGATIEALAAGTELRPGASLADYGVQWVVFTGDTKLNEAMASQLDLRPLPQLVYEVLESDVDGPRAITDEGVAWRWERPDYTGVPTNTNVRIAENADDRWGPGEWERAAWANRVAGDSGIVTFGGVSLFRILAQLAAALAIVLVGAAVWGRPPPPPERRL